jgi:hypothetical protein
LGRCEFTYGPVFRNAIAGTQAAAEFFSSAKRLTDLRRLFQKEGYAGFPSAYQVVVRSNVFGTSALDVQYVTHRVIAK